MISCLACGTVPWRMILSAGRAELRCSCSRLSVRRDRTAFSSRFRRALVFHEGFIPAPLEDVMEDVLAEEVLKS